MDARTVAAMRLALALSALLLLYLDPSGPGRPVAFLLTALVLYIFYSAILYALALHHAPLFSSRSIHWVDVGWCGMLVALSGGITRDFFLLFFFPILVASFGWSFVEGLRVALCLHQPLYNG